MKLDIEKIHALTISDFLGNEFECECGKRHRVGLKKVMIEKGAVQKLPSVLNEFQCKNLFMVADTNTYMAAGQSVEAIVNVSGFKMTKLVFERAEELVPDEAAIGEFLAHIAKDTEVIITVGSGVLNDLSKYISYKLNIPSIIVATAPSMDGYASDSAALILHNVKVSLAAVPPIAILGDTDILKNAPLKMVLAGLGDMLGKYSAFRDWRLGNIVLGEYYCEAVVKIVEMSLEKCVMAIDGFNKKDETAVKSLMEGLVLSGIAMSYVGNSRPASGAEHHISHFWEMMFLLDKKKAVLHGTKVGIATIAVNKMSEILAGSAPDFNRILHDIKEFDGNRWKSEIIDIYREAAPEIVKKNEKSAEKVMEERRQRIEKIKSNWDLITKAILDIPSAKEIENYLRRAGAPTKPWDIGIDEATIVNSVVYAKEVRPRYTILQLLWDMGLISEYAGKAREAYHA